MRNHFYYNKTPKKMRKAFYRKYDFIYPKNEAIEKIENAFNIKFTGIDSLYIQSPTEKKQSKSLKLLFSEKERVFYVLKYSFYTPFKLSVPLDLYTLVFKHKNKKLQTYFVVNGIDGSIVLHSIEDFRPTLKEIYNEAKHKIKTTSIEICAAKDFLSPRWTF